MESKYFVAINSSKHWWSSWYIELRTNGMTVAYDKRGCSLGCCVAYVRDEKIYKEVKKEELPFYLH